MGGRRPSPERPSHERWLVSYADFITLLFAFFVVMFASAQADKARAQQVSESVREALEQGGVMAVVHDVLGGTRDKTGKGNAPVRWPATARKPLPADPGMVELLPSLQYLSQELEKEIQGGKLQVRLEARGLVISLREATFFPSGEDRIDPATYPTIGKIAVTLRSLPNPLRLEGHTDSVPIHTPRFRSNWDLSAARGIAMLQLLTQQFKIPEKRLAVAGYADTAPVDSNETAEGRAHNRRVDLVILNQRALISEPPSSVAGNQQPAEPPSKN
jgi:chemotaxis protein MotB